MTVSILETLARLPGGGSAGPLDHGELGPYLRDKAQRKSQGEIDRNARHSRRDRLYQDGGDQDMCSWIDTLFKAESVKARLKARVPEAKFSNALKRIVGELSTVYAEPARRYVDNAADQAKLDEFVSSVDLDEQLDVVNAMLNLHRALLVGPRVRVNADGTREIVIDIATPSTVRAVLNPLDATQVFAWLIRVDMPMARNPYGRKPEWTLWSDHEWVYLDGDMNPISESWTTHGLGMNRWVPLSYSARAMPGFWPGCEGEDLVACHMTMWLCAVLMLKETQSTTKQPIVSGDVSTMARGQASDSSEPIVMPDGVTVTNIDVGTDPDAFIRPSDHALERTGNNYGLSMGALTHQGTQSAEARDLLLAPIRERRRKQIKIMRRFEARLIKTVAAVLAVDMPDMAFDPAGYRVDFGDAQTALSKRERLELFEKERGLGLTNTVEFMLAENPDTTSEQATADMAANIAIETARNVLMRPLQAVAGSMGATVPAIEQARQQPPNAGKESDDDMAWVDEVIGNAA